MPWALGGAPIWAGSPVPQAKALHCEGPGRSTCTVHAKTPSRISPRHPRKLPVLIRVECKSMRFGKQIQGECHCWLFRDNLRGQEWGTPQLGMLLKAAWIALEMRPHCRLASKGWGHHWKPPAGTGMDSHQSEHIPVFCNFLLVSATTGPSYGHLLPPSLSK